MFKARPALLVFLPLLVAASVGAAEHVTMSVDPASGQIQALTADQESAAAAKGTTLVTVLTSSPRAERVNATRRPQTASRERWVGQKAIIFDEATRTLRKPTDAETASLVRSLRELTSSRTAGFKPVIMSDGSRRGALDGGYANIVIARATADGEMETRCVQSFEEAVDFLGLTSVTTRDK